MNASLYSNSFALMTAQGFFGATRSTKEPLLWQKMDKQMICHELHAGKFAMVIVYHRSGCLEKMATLARPRMARTPTTWVWCWSGCMGPSSPPPRRPVTALKSPWVSPALLLSLQQGLARNRGCDAQAGTSNNANCHQNWLLHIYKWAFDTLKSLSPDRLFMQLKAIVCLRGLDRGPPPHCYDSRGTSSASNIVALAL